MRVASPSRQMEIAADKHEDPLPHKKGLQYSQRLDVERR